MVRTNSRLIEPTLEKNDFSKHSIYRNSEVINSDSCNGKGIDSNQSQVETSIHSKRKPQVPRNFGRRIKK